MINTLIDFDIRHTIFQNATRFVDYELIDGDIFEFGVYTGRSLALLSYYHELNKKSIHRIPFTRKVIGFDSFNGLPDSGGHPRWKRNLFGINHSFHPICKIGEIVTEKVIFDLFNGCLLPPPIIESGEFSSDMMQKYKKAAIIHIDCDLYESTKLVLSGMYHTLQEGTIILFDDWFNFKGNRNKGEQKAFYEFIKDQNKWIFIEYQKYATFGNSFIVSLN